MMLLESKSKNLKNKIKCKKNKQEVSNNENKKISENDHINEIKEIKTEDEYYNILEDKPKKKKKR